MRPVKLPPFLATKKGPKAKAFRSFHQQHPRVYAAFAAYADSLHLRGVERANALSILATLRSSGLGRINNDHAPFYARLYAAKKRNSLFTLRD